MHISIIGASGKVGREIVNLIANDKNSSLTASKIVSPESPSLGHNPPLTGDEYFALSKQILLASDIAIDFSTPAATMQMLDLLQGSAMPIVVGTTGFSDQQIERLRDEGKFRPILVGANFTYGFESFLAAGLGLVAGIPDAEICIGEIYNEHKKPAASGTTQRIDKEIAKILGKDGDTGEISKDIQRIGDTAGVNVIKLSLGFATFELKLTVHSRQAYAAGALAAAKWLITQPNGLYTPADTLSKPL